MHRKFYLVLTVIISILFISCTNNVPQINNASVAIIWDYETYNSLPQARLGVFVEASSNPARFEKIQVFADGTDIFWETDKLISAENNGISWCGYTNFTMPKGSDFPVGNYTIKFIQADEKELEMKASLTYEKSLYNKKASEIPVYMNGILGSKYFTVYDENKKVLYYGQRTNDYSDSRAIWNHYKDAVEFQESWISSSGTIICNMPVEKVTPDN